MASSITVNCVLGSPSSSSSLTFHYTVSISTVGSFDLAPGDSRVLSGLSAGTYSVTQNPYHNWATTVEVSNDTPAYAIVIGDADDVTVTFTNTLIVAPTIPASDWKLLRFSGKARTEETS